MDCPVCYESITTETGQVTTSCGHTFHFKCLNSWYYTQINSESGQESCPCCRKEPGEFERAPLVDDDEDESEEEEENQFPNINLETEWVRVGPRRWIIPSSDENRLQILAQLASEEPKLDPFHIPPYSEEAHAYWVLRHLFEEPSEATGLIEELHPLDRPKMVRKRCLDYGRTFWVHLGKEYKLGSVDGYKSD